MGLRILFLAFEVPYPLDRGGRIKTYHFLRALAKYHQVTLVAITRSEQQTRDLAEHFSFCEAIIGVPVQLSLGRKLGEFARSLTRPTPFMISLYDIPAIRREIQHLLEQKHYDALYFDHLHMAQYRPHHTHALLILDEHNIETALLERVYQNMPIRPEKFVAGLEWHKMQRYEPSVCHTMDHVITTTEVDARALYQWGLAPDQVHIIPIGVDTEYFQPPTSDQERRKDLTIIGTLGWLPNVEGVLWFYSEVFPMVRQACPDVRLNIIGDRCPDNVKALGQDHQVSVLGYVDDIRPYLHASAALLVPLRTGSGMRAKILSGLAAGIPILSTPVGYEGIAVEPDKHLLSAARPADFAQAAIQLLEKPELRKRLTAEGRDFVVQQYSWEKIYGMIGAFSEKLCASTKARSQ